MDYPVIRTSGIGVSMTVAELIRALQQMPQDALVITAGCDCDGKVEEVRTFMYDKKPAVYLNRERS